MSFAHDENLNQESYSQGNRGSNVTFYFTTAIFGKTNWLLSNHVLSEVHPLPSITTSFKSILILSSHLHISLPKGLFPSGFPTKALYAFLDCSICAMCPAHLSRLDFRLLIMSVLQDHNPPPRLLIMLGEEYNACTLLYSRTPLIYAALSR